MIALSDIGLERAHELLALALLVCTVFVWYGVHLEDNRFPEKTREDGERILKRSLALEAMLGFFILSVDAQITARFQDELSAANEKATIATGIATDASDSLKELRKTVDSEKKGVSDSIKALNGQEVEAETAISQSKSELETLRSEGPRSILLQQARPVIVKGLKKFGRQPAVVLVCGGIGNADSEKNSTALMLFEILLEQPGATPIGAGWDANLVYDDRCLLMASLVVWISPLANDATRSAAQELAKQLMVVPHVPPKPVLEPLTAGQAFRDQEGEHSLTRILRENPNLVVVEVGAHLYP
jgi:hypothetical protein